jgi:hypothetical protein
LRIIESDPREEFEPQKVCPDTTKPGRKNDCLN